jgi:hypothetical protein
MKPFYEMNEHERQSLLRRYAEAAKGILPEGTKVAIVAFSERPDGTGEASLYTKAPPGLVASVLKSMLAGFRKLASFRNN